MAGQSVKRWQLTKSIYRTAKKRARKLRQQAFEFFGSARYSRVALFDLDKKLERYVAFRDGFFIEAGANDGLSQSNTYLLERFHGWRGLLIEPIPELAAQCRINRPRSVTVNAALVANSETKYVSMKAAHLMSKVNTFSNEDEAMAYVRLASEAQNLTGIHDVDVPARTLSSILQEAGTKEIDLFSLDVEGYEMEVLRGLDLSRHVPRYILVETKAPDAITEYLTEKYTPIAQLTHHDYLYQSRVSYPKQQP